jgi:NTP pyrophosphatase (non-canonical NTP hydrolase)
MENNVLNNYKKFVDGVTSEVSKDDQLFIERIIELSKQGVSVSRLMTSGTGLASEGGEFNEIIKKLIWHGKEYNEYNVMHMKKELGDVLWYWMNACISLKLDPISVIEENVKKLEARYPGGTFSVWHSENRKEGDI